MTSVWRSRTRSRECSRARARWSAPSTGLASAPAMRPSKKSSWPCGCGATAIPTKPRSPASTCIRPARCWRRSHGFPCSPTRPSPAAMRLRTRPEFIRMAQSVGVPDSRLVLGKHSGRHALALRCEQLGHQFERRELDEVYRKFVILADRIKKVQDSHLLELIQDVISGDAAGKKFPPAAAPLPFPRAAVAGANSNSNDSHPAHVSGSAGQATVSIPFTDHHSEQEDYLWGV